MQQVAVIGSGPAGYTAALYAARACLDVILFTGQEPGGQLTTTTDVENYPGFKDPIQGPWLMDQMREQTERLGVKFQYSAITQVNFKQYPFHLQDDAGKAYLAKSVIIATGAQAKWLGLESELKFRGYGISGCATCDGFFFKNKNVLVVGGGNVAVEEAIYLSNLAASVTLIHRRDQLRAEKILQERLFSQPKIQVIWNTVLNEVLGTDNPLSVTGARLKNTVNGDLFDLAIDGIFVAIGHKPNTEVFADQLKLDHEGYVITAPGTTKTGIDGVFACGDVQDKIYRQAVTAAGTGCMAALDAERFLHTLGTVRTG